MRLTDAEWPVMEILWSGERFSLRQITQALKEVNRWNKNTVYTYLTRMAQKGLVHIDHTHEQPYSAAVTREECARTERHELLQRVYGGAAGDLIAAFIGDGTLSPQEAARLKKLLDDMEV